MHIEVTLTWTEVMMAAMVGVMRQVQNLRANRIDRYGASKEDGWTLHIEGACGEQAFAKATGRFWSGALGDLQAADVGKVQIRTGLRHEHKLILHPDDADDAVWVLVTGRAPVFHIVGWCYGHEGKLDQHWQDPVGGRAAFFVPHDALRSIETLSN